MRDFRSAGYNPRVAAIARLAAFIPDGTMARKQALKSTGKLVVLDHESKILAGNPLGDPTRRKLAV